MKRLAHKAIYWAILIFAGIGLAFMLSLIALGVAALLGGKP